ncbi:hypothetical protein G4X40_06090 [Rhodococcus sp. D2-41]|uniref:Uncharacterized protein n=1 Tax=Speluncibacter jeojiensis TaxID=2710754 RepID=A0A9X4M3C1_9ACTN|nr:hypothetical protein [Rhodococcus sp. D2-41]MDG3009715.1 hypothetical protein [Rhodococcus sp. D2-41]MDG3014463.1 hypothetical protein [Corynebacteriales bacterium D3-21]
MLRLTVTTAPQSSTALESLALITLDEIQQALRRHGLGITRTASDFLAREGERHTFVLDPPTAGEIFAATTGSAGAAGVVFGVSGTSQAVLDGPLRAWADALRDRYRVAAVLAG